jgi:transposase
MAFREVAVTEIREVLRAWLAGAGLRKVAEQAGVDRKTARRYVEAAVAAGLAREGGASQLTDELVGEVAQVIRPVRPGGHGQPWELLEARRAEIGAQVKAGLSVVKIGVLLERRGVVVPYRTLHRFCVERCGFGRTAATVRVADGEPGAECQLDFGYLGLLTDPVAGRQRKVHALIFTACYSRHMFVWLSFTQTLAAVIAGCEAAWVFFGGVFKVLVPDNASAIVAAADAVNPRFTAGWLDYAQHCGFATDAARVRSPCDKPRVERAVQYVRGNFFAGETFAGLTDAQAGAEAWCREVAGMRIHGTIAARPAEVFAEHEATALLPLSLPYDVPVFTSVKVHRDFHVEVGRALYSAPKEYLGCRLDARADSALVKLFHRGVLVKAHPRQQPGRRVTDPADLPAEKTTYAMRDVASLAKTARRHGDAIGVYAERLLDTDLPGRRCGRSTGCSGWSAATGPDRSTPRASGRSTLMSSTSPRSPRCWQRRPRTPRPRPARRWPRPPGSPATRPSTGRCS